jgi:hypothetical protein
VLRHSDATRQLEIQELVKQIRGHLAVEGYRFPHLNYGQIAQIYSDPVIDTPSSEAS